eukprot:9846886-Alexandrium_andersonii.AAC.1
MPRADPFRVCAGRCWRRLLSATASCDHTSARWRSSARPLIGVIVRRVRTGARAKTPRPSYSGTLWDGPRALCFEYICNL